MQGLALTLITITANYLYRVIGSSIGVKEMPNATYYIGESPNEGTWDLGDITGQQFEDLLAKAVAWHLCHVPASVQVTQTRRAQDGGKDIVVHSTMPITLFCFKLKRNDKPSYKVY
ncbi:MAG TPA: hypothetical protein VLX28_02095, partial [Thermoanaerobaculia bacterium]|nr:hypothetical protein [Thermoanaerobaculia bacterium]